MDTYSSDRVEGYPSCVRWAAGGNTAIDWWAPTRIGDDAADFIAGQFLLASSIELLRDNHKPTSLHECVPLNHLGNSDPRLVLTFIVISMERLDSVERGFVAELARKAMVGQKTEFGSCEIASMEVDREGIEYANLCIDLARMFKDETFLTEALGSAITGEMGAAMVLPFVWTVSAAALAGGLH